MCTLYQDMEVTLSLLTFKPHVSFIAEGLVQNHLSVSVSYLLVTLSLEPFLYFTLDLVT